MSRIGIVTEQSPETRVAATPATVKQLTALGYEVVVEAGAGAGSAFLDDAYAEAGARVTPSAAEALASDLVLKVNAPHRLRDRPARARHDDHRPPRPRVQARAARGARGARSDRARDGRGAAHLARPVDGRAQLDGEHLGLPRRRRGRARVRPVLHRAGHGGRQGAPREGARRRRRRRGARRDRRGLEPRRDRAGDRPAARGRRPGEVDRRRVPEGRGRGQSSRPTATPRRRAKTTTGAPPRSTPSRLAMSTSSSRPHSSPAGPHPS